MCVCVLDSVSNVLITTLSLLLVEFHALPRLYEEKNH